MKDERDRDREKDEREWEKEGAKYGRDNNYDVITLVNKPKTFPGCCVHYDTFYEYIMILTRMVRNLIQ